MVAGDLTTLSKVRQWLQLQDSNTASDNLLSRLIKSASGFVLSYLNRDDFALRQYTEVYDGYGNRFMVLRRSPVYEVLQLSFYGVPVPKATGDGFNTPFTNGWQLQPEFSISGAQRINLYGRVFPRERQSIAVRYTSGYVVHEERRTIPATPFTIQTHQTYLGNVSVSSISGAPFEEVAQDPEANQYTVNSDGEYTFNAADEGTTVLLSYSYVPADVENAVIEMVGERFRYMDRIGYTSKSLGGQETVSFSQASMSAYIKESLTPYKAVVPVA